MRGIALGVIYLGFVGSAFAHGPAPAALDAASDSQGNFAFVHTNIGLAVPKGDGSYRYVCPAQWGSEDSFPGALLDDSGGIVIPRNFGRLGKRAKRVR